MERLLIVKIHRTATSPAPAGNSTGKTTERIFDSIGRLQKDVIVNTGAYTRYEYPTTGIQSKVYSTIVDTNNNNTGDAADEVLSESWFDGAGRLRQARVPHTFNTNGITATWAGTLTEYDILGRVKRASVPTEVDANFNPTGDDYRGMNGNDYVWLWNSQEYDWKGRVIKTIPTDSNGNDGKESLITYEGCGCAGGQVTTIQGPLVPRDDQPTVNARRTQKSYEDILGRTFKTETLTWTGGVYSTVKSTFNGRDQATLIREYSGSDTSSAFQDTTVSFDGHGRVYQSHKPQQRDGTTLKYTTYSYNADDSISTVTDGRGAVTNYTYNSRGLVTGKSWTVPQGSGITDPADVSYSYDNLGNRTHMTDALGTVDYSYDSLSRMANETRAYNTTDTDFTNNTYTLSYTYTLAGQLKSYGASFDSNRQISYVFDKVSRLTGVTGSYTGGSTNYVTGAAYRAWGAPKQIEYGNGVEMSAGGFNNALQATTFSVKKSSNNNYIINKSYEFNNDGSMKKETDSLDARFDRSYNYDFSSRMTKALTGAEARGLTDSYSNIPYHNTYGYDAFDHRTSIGAANFAAPGTPITMAYTNNRVTSSVTGASTYDNDGNPTTVPADAKVFSYNAAGQMYHTYMMLTSGSNYSQQQETITYDGDGLPSKVVTSEQLNEDPPDVHTTYRARSTMLGGQVIWENGPFNVYAGGTRIAVGSYYWMHEDANGHTIRSTDPNGNLAGDGGNPNAYWDKKELDPDGKQTGFSVPIYYPLENNDIFAPMSNFGVMSDGQYTSYKVDGINVPADFLAMRLGDNRSGDLGLQLLHFSVIESYRIREWRFVGLDGYDHTFGVGRVPQRAVDMLNRGWANAYATLDNSWSAINLILESKYFNIVPGKQKDVSALNYKDINAAKNFLKDSLDKKCKDAIAKLIDKLGELTGVKPISTDLETLFTQIAGQAAGGIKLNLDNTIGTGSLYKSVNADHKQIYGTSPLDETDFAYGYSFRGIGAGRTFGKRTGRFEAFVYLSSRLFVTGSKGGFNMARQQSLNDLIHELVHVSASLPNDPKSFTYTYSEEKLKEAAKLLGFEGIGNYIDAHCKAK